MERHEPSSKDERPDPNEEFTTDDQERRPAAEELNASDLHNLLAATDIAMLFLDRQLRILRFTPRMRELFIIRPADRGRPLADLTRRFGYDGLPTDARLVLDALTPSEHEIQSNDGRWYLTRIRPYRTAEGRSEGIVITFVDITERKHNEKALKELTETLEKRVEERTQQVQALASTLTMAEQEERRRIAQILHDDLQQRLYGVQLKLNLLHQVADAGNWDVLQENLEEAEAWLKSSIAVTRKLTVDLSPPILKNEGLTDAVGWLVTQLEALHGLKVDLQADHAFVIADDDMRVLLFQIVRELLFNVIQHAGVRQATVELREVNDHLLIRVTDTGSGFDVDAAIAQTGQNEGLGLFSIRERLRLFGGRMEITSHPGEGTRVMIHTPAI